MWFGLPLKSKPFYSHPAKCPLSGVKRTWAFALQMSAFDAKRTFERLSFAVSTHLIMMARLFVPKGLEVDRADPCLC